MKLIKIRPSVELINRDARRTSRGGEWGILAKRRDGVREGRERKRETGARDKGVMEEGIHFLPFLRRHTDTD